MAGLDKHWLEKPDDLNRGRIYAQELLKHGRLQRAEQVLSKIVAKGGVGDDWLALGIAQLQQTKLDKAEGTLKGAQNLMKDNPYPALHLAKLSGIDQSLVVEALTPGAGGSWALDKLGSRIAKGDFNPGFYVDLIQKDLRIVQDAAKKLGLPLQGTAALTRSPTSHSARTRTTTPAETGR